MMATGADLRLLGSAASVEEQTFALAFAHQRCAFTITSAGRLVLRRCVKQSGLNRLSQVCPGHIPTRFQLDF